MSKLIVDQIQTSGGPVLTLPDAGAPEIQEGDFLAVDADGRLTFLQPDFSPLTDAINDFETSKQGLLDDVQDIADGVDAAIAGLGNINADDPSNRLGQHKININTAFGGSELRIYIPPAEDLMQNNGSTGNFNVGCNEGTYCGSSGNSCSWTVPAGVTEAQFQVWGAGGSGGGSREGCCQFGSMGANGEYTFAWLPVTEGDTYTLCGGGACQNGGCNGGYSCHGCNSYVCGGNGSTRLTCIMSCGGSGYCEVQYGCYPRANRFGMFFATSSGSVGSYCTMALGICNDVHGQEAYRGNAQCLFGCVTSTETLTNCAKIPSAVGTIRVCGCMNCALHHDQAPLPNSNHSLCRNTIGWAYCGGGCLCTNAGCYGLGGWGTVNISCCCIDYGSHGRVGSVCVNYK